MRSGTASTLPRWSSRLGLPCAPLSGSGLADRQRAGLGLLTEQALALFALTLPHGRIYRLLGHDAGPTSTAFFIVRLLGCGWPSRSTGCIGPMDADMPHSTGG